MEYFILSCAFLTVMLIVVGIYSLMFSDREAMLIRLEYDVSGRTGNLDPKEIRKNLTPGKRLMEFSAFLGNLVPKSQYLLKTKKKLVSAAVLMKPEEFLGLCIICGGVAFALVMAATRLMIIAALSALIGFFLPEFILSRRKRRRMNQLNAQLPETLNVIANGLRAGFSFTQAISVAVKDMGPPISEELSRVLRENTLGKSLDESLVSLSERNDDEDLSMTVTALLIQRQVGGNLAEILDTISHTIRERVRIKGEIKTLTAQGRLSATIICLLPTAVALILSLLSPEYILTLFRHPMGIGMVAVGVMMQMIGVYVIFKLVDIKV